MMETYYGCVRTPSDAIKLFEACRVGLLPRVQRRLSEKERQAIRSGSVFVWDEREAGMRRWTDGKSWSASRVSGSFLTYREMEGKRGAAFPPTRRVQSDTTPESGRGSDEDQDDGEIDGYRYKIDGLMKQSFSITTSTGQHLHLISYYSRPQAGQPDLPQPCTDPSLRHIVPAKGMYPESSVQESQGPALSRGPMQQTSYTLSLQQQPPPPVGPPQHGYPVQYAQQPAYWPPSPVATPPYSHPHYPPVHYPQPPLPPPAQHHYHPPPPPHHYHHPQPPYHHQPAPPPHHERSPLPPLQTPASHHPRGPGPLAHYAHPPPQHRSPHLTHQSGSGPSDSPRVQHLQAAAREAAVMIDPRLSVSGPRDHEHTQLPPIHSSHSSQQRLSPTPAVVVKTRPLSASPPRSSHSETVNGTSNGTGAGGSSTTYNKTSLSSLLHPTPSSSEPNSANPGTNSAGSSPRAPLANGVNGAAPGGKRAFEEDVRAKQILDKKFCI
jgi:hypothetical protein